MSRVFLNMDYDQCRTEMFKQRTLAAKSRRDGCRIDALNHDAYADALKNALDGVMRCNECGKILRRNIGA